MNRINHQMQNKIFLLNKVMLLVILLKLADEFSSMCGAIGWLMCGWSDGTKTAGAICLNPNNNKEWYLHKNGSNTYQDMSNTGKSAECQWHP